MKLYKLIFLLIFSLFLSPSSRGQGFSGKVIAGINASQLEGDNLKGFNKVGIHTGIGIEFFFLKNAIAIELLFNQKGSANKVQNSGLNQRMSTTLNYLQMPILYSLNSWYNTNENFYYISIIGGGYYARLFSTTSSNPGLSSFVDFFRKDDIGAVIGVQYRINKHISTSMRYDQSFLKIYNNPNNDNSGLLSYLGTVRMEYYF
ncbi:MAG: outer membrane beta-barrel protein [Saprospiraceae bacterium]